MEGNKRRTALFALGALVPLLAGTGIFCYANFARAESNNLIISEILVGGSSADEEFIELYNPTSADIDLKLLPLKLHIISSTEADTSKTLTYSNSNSIIRAHDYFLLASPSFKDKHSEVAAGITYSASLVSNGATYISISATKNSDVIDLVCWGSSKKCDSPLPDPKQNYSLERIGNGLDWQESCETGGTPGKESKECETEQSPPKEAVSVGIGTDAGVVENFSSAEKVYLNEIFPNTNDDEEEEYIEIKNEEDASVDLYGWTIRDASKTGKYVFKDHAIIEPGEYLVIKRPQSKIALNNSQESVYLYNPQGEITSSVSYEKSQKDSSYNFDGKIWRWSKYLTPDEKNKFDSEPEVKISKVKNSYKDFNTKFSAVARDKETKKLKYVWDFGDGKKSYLKNTSHKYLDTGKYTVTLAVTDDSQTIEKSFVLAVKNYPRADLEIVKILPNPVGNDSAGEIVEIKNNSRKKIDLTGWKIATGSSTSKLYNHPISGELSLAPNGTKTITRESSKFSLNNKAGKVQLVSPGGKIADTVEYAKEKIAEDEAYAKINGEWQWLSANTPEENIVEDGTVVAADKSDDTGDTKDATSDSGEVLGATDEAISTVASYKPRFTSEDAYIFLSHINFMRPTEETDHSPICNPSSNIAYLLASLI